MSQYSYQSLNVQWAPLIEPHWLGLFIIMGSLLTLIPLLRGKNINLWLWRCLALTGLIIALANPQILEEERISQPDTVLIITDKSESQNFQNRDEIANKIEKDLKEKLAKIKNLDIRTAVSETTETETILFQTIEQNLADIPKSRRAGTIIISDGQIHDIPNSDTTNFVDDYGPVHTILTGKKGEKDRHIKLIKTPSYGIIGQTVSVSFIVENDNGSSRSSSQSLADIDININDDTAYKLTVPIGEEQTITFPIEHAGQNIMSLKVDPLDGEITERNNQAAIIVNGLRDRLKVLLVSGKPHMGERTWRNLLTSDPGIDLVHFTILRDPTKSNPVPSNELSLIPFPVQELFEVKLYDFDLIIFDRYKLSRIMPKHYFSNIAKYVYKGGALLVTSGPDFSGGSSIMTTTLEKIIPGKSVKRDFQEEYTPTLTDSGKIHPVTNELKQSWKGEWGPWLWQAGVRAENGHTLMNGYQDRPLLIIERVGEGRVAQIASDQIWLWSKGYKGGGPQAELLRRLSHWLMKEPDLEEDSLNLITGKDTLTIKRRNFNDNVTQVEVISPSGETKTIELTPPATEKSGLWSKTIDTSEQGIYRVGDGTQVRLAIIGSVITKELSSVVTTEEKLKEFNKKNKTGAFWFQHEGLPKVRMINMMPNAHDRTMIKSGRDWLGLKANNDFTVAQVKQYPLLPYWLFLITLLSLSCWAWWKESR